MDPPIAQDMNPLIAQDMNPLIAQDEIMQMDFTAPVQGNVETFMELTNLFDQAPIEEEDLK